MVTRLYFECVMYSYIFRDAIGLIRVWTIPYTYDQRYGFFPLFRDRCLLAGGTEWPYTYETPQTCMGSRCSKSSIFLLLI